MLRVLLLAANPFETGRLALDEEAREIREKLRATSERSRIDLQFRAATRPDDLLHELNEYQPHVVHFSGHGEGEPGIVLASAAGGSQLVTGGALRRLFAALKDEIRVVVLSACYSESQAREIVEVIDFVVSMRHGIDDASARVFASSFYRALAFGRSVGNAFDQGAASIALHGLPDEDSPTLSCRSGLDASNVILLNDPIDPRPAQLSRTDDTPVNGRQEQPEDAMGIIDYREVLEEETEQLGEIGTRMALAMGRFNEATNRMTGLVGAAAEKAGGSVATGEGRRLLNEYAEVMDAMTDSFRSELPGFSRSIDKGLGAMASISLLMRDELPASRAAAQENADMLKDLLQTIEGALESMKSFRERLNALPRMTKRLNTARREGSEVLEKMIFKMEDGVRHLKEAGAATNEILEKEAT